MNMKELIASCIGGGSTFEQEDRLEMSDEILAMLERPTANMIVAVQDRHYMGEGTCPTCGGGIAAYRAMIKAARDGR